MGRPKLYRDKAEANKEYLKRYRTKNEESAKKLTGKENNIKGKE